MNLFTVSTIYCMIEVMVYHSLFFRSCYSLSGAHSSDNRHHHHHHRDHCNVPLKKEKIRLAEHRTSLAQRIPEYAV